MTGAPSIINFGVFEAGLAQTEQAICRRLEQRSIPFEIARQTESDWAAFFEADGDLFEPSHAKIFLFELNADRTAYSCNLADGWYGLFWNISEAGGIDGAFFRTTTRPDEKYAMHKMEVWRQGKSIRHLETIQSQNWHFASDGDPLAFETVADLMKPRIEERFNRTHIERYCREFGIEFRVAYSFPGPGTLISRTRS